MKTVHHGADFSIPLHPEHHQEIAKLKDQQEHKFKDETGRHWTAKKMGDNIHFQGANGGGTTHVPAHTMSEKFDPLKHVKNPTDGEKKAAKDVKRSSYADRAAMLRSAEADGRLKEEKPGLYANINAKRKRIEAGSGERMRKPGSEGAPSAKDFKDAAKTVKEAKDEQEYGYEGDMALNQLATLIRCAEMIKDTLKPDTDLPEWVQSKITLATDYIVTAADYLHSELEEQAPVAPVPDKKYIKGTPENKAYKATKKPINGMPTNKEETLLSRIAQIAEAMKKCKSCGEKHEGSCSYKEEVELQEANHREFASQGKMHPDMAKHMTVGQEHDYYEHGTGDKVSGKVMHKSATEVHMKQTHDSYDPKKKGTVHKFKISDKMDEEVVSEEQGYTLQSKHTNADGTTTVTLKTPDGKIKKHTGKDVHKVVKRMYGVQSEEVVQEKINMDKASMGDVIKDFKNSDAPQFKGKSDEKRRQMAIAAKLSAQRNEEEEMTLSFKDYLNEVKLADLPVRKVSGSYGTEYYKKEKEKDEKGYDSEDNEKSSPEKRGRGRPKGASSGARQKGSTTGKKRSGVEMTGYPLHLPNR
jgi:hypothetical protein